MCKELLNSPISLNHCELLIFEQVLSLIGEILLEVVVRHHHFYRTHSPRSNVVGVVVESQALRGEENVVRDEYLVDEDAGNFGELVD